MFFVTLHTRFLMIADLFKCEERGGDGWDAADVRHLHHDLVHAGAGLQPQLQGRPLLVLAARGQEVLDADVTRHHQLAKYFICN